MNLHSIRAADNTVAYIETLLWGGNGRVIGTGTPTIHTYAVERGHPPTYTEAGLDPNHPHHPDILGYRRRVWQPYSFGGNDLLARGPLCGKLRSKARRANLWGWTPRNAVQCPDCARIAAQHPAPTVDAAKAQDPWTAQMRVFDAWTAPQRLFIFPDPLTGL